MSEAPEQWAFLSTGWRVAYTWTGCREGASKTFQETVAEVLRHPGEGDLHSITGLFYTVLRKRVLRFPARCELTGLAENIHRQPEPGRSALTLLLLEALSADEIALLLSLDKRAYTDTVEKAQALVNDDPATAGAPPLSALELGPEGEKNVEEAGEALTAKHDGNRISVRNPALIAVGFGFLLLIAVLTWHMMGEVGVFPDEALKIATTGGAATEDQFDAVDNSVADLEDWFMLKGFDSFRPAPGFEKYHVVGVRLFKFENESVAQAVVPENTMFFYSFSAEPLGIDVTPEKSWRITESGRDVMAIREDRGVCFMVAFRGTKAQMEDLLNKAQAAAKAP